MNHELEKVRISKTLELWVQSTFEPRNTVALVGKVCDKITESYRALAIISLLIDADTDTFYHDLIRSAKTREYYLTRCKLDNYSDFRISTSRNEPFFDALAANDFGLARQLADLSPKVWRTEYEYEDDFYYTRIFHDFTSLDDMNNTPYKTLLRRFEESLEGSESARFKLCYALIGRNQQGFEKAFNELLIERTDAVEQESRIFLSEDINVALNHKIFIEGLAILRVAERIGLKTYNDYLYCPAIARQPTGKPFSGEGYPKLRTART